MNELIPSTEEERLLGILNDEWWQKKASENQIKDTSIAEAKLTRSGVVAMVKLSAGATMAYLIRRLASIRTMLDVQDEHETQILPGGRASLVALAIRTRRVTDNMDMTWRPGITSLGVDTVTGQEVHVSPGARMIVAGASGSGKSWATRPRIAPLILDPAWEVTLLDGKGDEANVWSGVVRTAVEPEEIIDCIECEHADMMRRKAIMKKRGLTMWDPELGPNKLLLVDEGRVVLSNVDLADKIRKKELDAEDVMDIPILRKLIDLSSLGRSRGITLDWCTQYPVTSGSDRGIDSNIKANTDATFCLRVVNETQGRVVLDDDVAYGPQNIPFYDPKRAKPGEWDTRGHGYLGGYGPNLIRAWTLDDDGVRALGIQDRMPPVGDGTSLSTAPPDKVRAELEKGPGTSADVARQTGMGPREVAKIMEDLMVLGEVVSRYKSGSIVYQKATSISPKQHAMRSSIA